MAAQHGIQIKTKIAKGPNPLSAKKKQVKVVRKEAEDGEAVDDVEADEGAEDVAEGAAKPKRKRIRKRNKKEQSQAD